MDTTVLKRYQPNRAVGMALALGLLASIALAAVTFDLPNDDPAVLPSAQANLALLAKEQRYYDAKMARIDRMEAGALYVAPPLSNVPGPHQGVLEGAVPGIDVFPSVPMGQLLDEYAQYNPDVDVSGAPAAEEQLFESPRSRIGALTAEERHLVEPAK